MPDEHHMQANPSKGVITHQTLEPWLEKLKGEPYFQCGTRVSKPPEWAFEEVTLEFPVGELCKDGLTTLALIGRQRPEPIPLTGREAFNAQGLEGKVQVRKPLINALLNLRDLLPPFRGRILFD